jgi:hypothetical protein
VLGEIDIEADEFAGILDAIETHGLRVGSSIIDTEDNRLLNLRTGDWKLCEFTKENKLCHHN